MYDYRLLEALAAVCDQGGFERGGEALFLTQSAVSQRIKTLEDQEGQILLSRSTPPVPTARGRELIKHLRKVRMLEAEMDGGEIVRTMKVGINADSLATWFLDGIEPYLEKKGRFLDLKVDDQDKTREMLRKGEVSGCIGSDSRPLQGCGVKRLGMMEYCLICTPSFQDNWFPRGLDKETVKYAPAVIFNRDDQLHERFLKRIFPDGEFSFPVHYIPSPEQFLNMILRGKAYGAIPLMQCALYLGGSLREIADFRIDVDLFWHHWNMETEDMKDLTRCLIERGSALIR